MSENILIEIKKKIDENLPEKQIKKLYELEEVWKNTAFDQSVKNKENKRSVSSLVDKLSSEVIELEREMDYYNASTKKYKYADEALKEACDVANMAQILMPMTSEIDKDSVEHFPEFRDMVNSILYHKPRYDFLQVVSFDSSKSYSRQELFEIYIKNVDSVIVQQKMKFEDNANRISDTMTRFHKSYLMIHKDMDEYLEQNNFDRMKPHINMKPKWTRLAGDMVTQALLVAGEIDGASYEKFFVEATQKMMARDKRYNGINRLDEKN